MTALCRAVASGLVLRQGVRCLGSMIPTLQRDADIAASRALAQLPPKVASFVERSAILCKPKAIHVCDGSEAEMKKFKAEMCRTGMLEKLDKYHECYLARTDPNDVARVEKKTFVVTEKKTDAVPEPQPGVEGMLGNWMSKEKLLEIVRDRFLGCMAGRTMYVIPFSMGPIGSPISKIGIQLTDSPYVVASMKIMTRMGGAVLGTLDEEDFVRCLHSVGCPLPSMHHYRETWPCNPDQTIIAQVPDSKEIISFGSGYGGNSLLGKKCFALRIGSALAYQEGWLAEHMLILGITNPAGVKRYIAAAFPSACGKTNLAMMTPSLPGYKVECVGDDIAWMKFDDEGVLRAINPENGFFGVAPGTSTKTNPVAMKTIASNTLFTNVAKTDDGGVFWEGLEEETDFSYDITSWRNVHPWRKETGGLAAHPNSRFCTPASQCPTMDPSWEDPRGVPISAILFGSRRPEGVPMVYESLDWKHGVMIGAAMRSEATAAAEYSKKEIMHDPFAMRPFFGYNFGLYLKHWLSMDEPNRKLPKIFHVNWFRKGSDGKFLWPGFGQNIRVLDWIFRRLDGKDIAMNSPIGLLPKPGTIDLVGIAHLNIKIDELFHIPKDFWQKEVRDVKCYLEGQLGNDLPEEIRNELEKLQQRVENMQ
ncbi:hypothetical protein HAZT_HAZT011847 [Hyalella azteca]|uniref:Phosphoenolpyruvate carboxykinase [GTP] n=1 Tax=Hyalella azteca TaxID=294128 RepID=A0A6A0GSF9_HYAAZ|nr:hypothetical protein HAZT_HAZT011847 [Hyalella azteca]